MLTPYIIYVQIGFNKNQQKFNSNVPSAEKSPIFTFRKSYKNSLKNVLEKI